MNKNHPDAIDRGHEKALAKMKAKWEKQAIRQQRWAKGKALAKSSISAVTGRKTSPTPSHHSTVKNTRQAQPAKSTVGTVSPKHTPNVRASPTYSQSKPTTKGTWNSQAINKKANDYLQKQATQAKAQSQGKNVQQTRSR